MKDELDLIKLVSDPATVLALGWLVREIRRLGVVVGRLDDTIRTHDSRLAVLEDRSTERGKK